MQTGSCAEILAYHMIPEPSRPYYYVSRRANLKTLPDSTQTPERYAAAVHKHFERSKETSLYPGVNYRNLALFLKQPFVDAEINIPVTPQSPHDYVLVHQLHATERKIHRYDAVEGHHAFTIETVMSPAMSQVVFLQGYPSAQWLNTLGAQYSLDPEFFRRHLDFLHSGDFFDLPALPSSSRNMITLPVTTICHRQTPWPQSRVRVERWESSDMVRKNQRQLGMNSDIGQSIVRRFSVHDESIFTLEQRISIILKKKHGTWVAVVWLDTGKELKDRPLAPLSLDLPNSRWLCRPVIQYQSKIAFRSHDTSCNSSVPPSDSAQSANLLASQYGSLLDHNSMRNDPMYALSELFQFSAASDCQFLNMMQHEIEKEFFVIEARTDWSLENLRYHKTLLDDHIQSMKGTLHALRRPLIPGSPAEERISEAVQNVLEDFTHLLEQAQTLAAKCIEGINTIVSTTQLKESREGIKQAEGLRRLTLLAFFFLPLSFTTSFFGMNFRELGTGTLSLWVVFVVLVPVVAVSSALCFWDELKDYLRFGYGTG